MCVCLCLYSQHLTLQEIISPDNYERFKKISLGMTEAQASTTSAPLINSWALDSHTLGTAEALASAPWTPRLIARWLL